MATFFTTNKDIFASFAVMVALLAFMSGLIQYRYAQKWKRMEFIASVVKDFSENMSVRNVLAMLDYRKKKFAPNGEVGPEIVVLHNNAKDHICVGREKTLLLAEALRFNHFSAVDDETRFVRENFDEYFGFFEKFAIFINSGLFSFSEIEPYLKYHFDLLNGEILHSQGYHEELFQYLVLYRFDWTIYLLGKTPRRPNILKYVDQARKLKSEVGA